jgi:hypothetical protein
MIGNFRLASDEELKVLMAEPSRVFEFLYRDVYGQRAVSGSGRAKRGGFFQRLFGGNEVVSITAAAGPGQPSVDPADELDVDKAWQGLHFLFTGDAWSGEPPLDFIGSGGTEVGEADVGYGPARAFTSAEVREISAALDDITRDELAPRFEPARGRPDRCCERPGLSETVPPRAFVNVPASVTTLLTRRRPGLPEHGNSSES